MPIEFAPPAPSMQGLQIQPPPQSNPLAVLANIQNMRTQRLQQEVAGNQLEMERQKLDSQKAMLDAMVQSGGDYEKTMKIAAASGKVLPGDLISMQEHRTKMQQDAATLDKTTRDNLATDIDRYRGLLSGVDTPEALAEANARAEQMGISRSVPRHAQFSDPTHVTAFSNSLASQSQILKEAQERAQTEQAEASKKLSGLQSTEAEQKIATGDRAQAIADMQAAIDPNTGVPSPADWAAIQKAHPKVMLPPGTPTRESVASFLRSGVAPEKVPEFDLNTMKAKVGLLGNSEFDQYQLRYAQSIGKKPIDLNFSEMQDLMQKYAKDRQDPGLLAAILGLKGAQQTVAQAQVRAIMKPEAIRNNAQDLLNGDLAPDQIRELRSGRINQASEIIEAARAMAKEQGRPFSLFDLEQQANLRENTLKEFTNTGISHAGGQKLALNTMIHHADLYLDAAAALKNGSFRPGNEVYNRVATMFGAAPPTNAALLAQFFAAETGKVATGGVPAEGEIKSILSKMSTDGSPEAMEGAGKTLISIAAGRMVPLKELRDKARLEKHVDIVGPDARQVLLRRGYNPETMKPWKVGDTVMYQGQPRKVKGINPQTGKLMLE